MPKIGTIDLLYEGDFHKKYEIHYKQVDRFSIKGLSDEFIGLTGFKTYGYETEAQLTDTVKDACRLYRKLKTNSKLIILYKCEASAELRMNKISENDYRGTLNGVSSKIADTGFGSSIAVFGVDFEIAQVIDDGVKKKYYKVNSETKEVLQWEVNSVKDYQEMDYTEERFDFFLNLVEGMKKMVLSASNFFGVEPEKAALFIESKQNIFLTNGSQNKEDI